MGRGNRNRTDDPEAAAESEALRLDKWVWFARFQRSREACAGLVRKGHVRVNSRKVTQPGSFVGIGDILTLALPGNTLVVEIIALAERREDAGAAALLYRVVEPTHRPG